MTTLLIGNCIYLPIDKDWNDKSEQKYVAGDMNGNIYLSQIYTKKEIEEKHKDSSTALTECKGIKGIVESY
jgi:hypothetical protein